jgi:hypothetical protein
MMAHSRVYDRRSFLMDAYLSRRRLGGGARQLSLALAVLLGAVIPAKADIISVSSNLPVTIGPPPDGTNVTSNFLVSNSLAPGIAFNEQQNVVLSNSLTTDTGTIAAGIAVDSHYIAFNNTTTTFQTTTITLDGTVLGLEFTRSGLGASDFLGLSTLTYQDDCTLCGYEDFIRDTVTFSGDQVFLDSRFSRPGDFIRIISTPRGREIPVPEPSSLELLTAGLLGLMAFGRRLQVRNPVA